jgi:tetratricopeptide (TPR) repeat protein
MVSAFAPVSAVLPLALLLLQSAPADTANALNEFLRADPATDGRGPDFGLTSATARRAVAQLRAGRIQSAITGLEAALEENPDSSEVRRALGLAWWAGREYDRSIEQLEAALELNSRNEPARLALVDVLAERGHLDRAADVLRRTIEIHPDSRGARARAVRLLAR